MHIFQTSTTVFTPAVLFREQCVQSKKFTDQCFTRNKSTASILTGRCGQNSRRWWPLVKCPSM